MDKWTKHNAKIGNQSLPPAETLLMAIKLYKQKCSNISKNKVAGDLGSGSGIDTVELLKEGWNVLAIDQDRVSLERLLKEVGNSDKLTIKEAHFETLELPLLDLVNASFSLPFCHPDYFGKLWATIVDSIPSRGIFCGHLFGLEDSWASFRTDMTFHNMEQVKSLLCDFDLHSIKEIKKQGITLTGHPKKWHIYAIVASKK